MYWKNEDYKSAAEALEGGTDGDIFLYIMIHRRNIRQICCAIHFGFPTFLLSGPFLSTLLGLY